MTSPNGAMVAVYSDSPAGRRYLLLHSAEVPANDHGEWSWGFPSGCREPGERIGSTASRELMEETGIVGNPTPVVTDDVGWAVYHLAVPWGTSVRLAPGEHNEYDWVTVDEAIKRLRPKVLVESFQLALTAIEQHSPVDRHIELDTPDGPVGVGPRRLARQDR